jgi:diguanylate cyclase (GGDEF)-like protein
VAAHGTKETPGSTTRMIIDHVRQRAGDESVTAVLARAGLEHRLDDLLDETRWASYDDKIALFESAAHELDSSAVAFDVGASILDGSIRELVPVLRALGGPSQALRAVIDAGDTFSPSATLELVELTDHHALLTYRLRDGLDPNPHDCQFTMGVLTQIGPVFDLPAADVEQLACRCDGADACVLRVSWAAAPRPRRLGRRERRERIRGLTARFWELDSYTPDLVADGDPSEALTAIEARAAEAIGAAGHVLILTDPDGTGARVSQHGLVGGVAALVDDVFQGLIADDDPRRIVVPVESERRRYGHLVFLFGDDHEHMPEERSILAAHARRVAVALDAAHAIRDARVREETASVLLHLSRQLSEVASVAEITSRLVEALPLVTGAHQASVMLWDDDANALRVCASVGVPEPLKHEVDTLVIPIEDAMRDAPASVADRPTFIPRADARGFIADLMDRHSESFVVLVPILLRGQFRGVIACGWRDSSNIGPTDVLEERVSGIADQTATALENAVLLDQVRHQALHDALTGLPNQTLFADRVTAEIVRARRNGTRLGVSVLDLDRFKTVNDSLGHSAGDHLLVQVTERLRHAVRAPDTIARMGGDEFTLLLPDLGDGGEAIVAERILDAFVQPFEVEGHRLRISPSIGIAAYPDDGDGFDQLLRCADVAMYRAKDRGRNTWACYASGMAERAYDRLTLETDLYRALQRREMRVAYQPIARLGSDGGVVGTEALVRWAHPTLGLLTPDEFLPIAEDLGLMAEIDGWVLRQACVELGNAMATGGTLSHVAVNLSARTLCHPALERLVGDALTAGGIDATRLVIDISESVTADRALMIGDALRALQARGVRVALDDFGRGSSALSRLEQLPIDLIKVDRMFLAGIDDVDAPAPVVEAIVAMGHGLGVEVVAEGVETEAQRAFAERLGFDLAQGWLLGRPGSALDYAGARSRTA